MSFIIVVGAIVLIYAISWGFTMGAFALAVWIFNWAHFYEFFSIAPVVFSWKIATAIWALICIFKLIFGSGNSSKE